MKKFALPLMSLTLAFTIACNEPAKTDSTEVAEEKNEKKMDSTDTENMEADQEFMVTAASGGMMEVELGGLASANAASADVKKFGQTMVADHSKANTELKALAAANNVSLPAVPGEKHQHHIDGLKDKKGADFDKDYMSMMVDDHEEDIKMFEKAATDAKNPELKAFAEKTLPVLKKHLEMAKTINDGLKK